MDMKPLRLTREYLIEEFRRGMQRRLDWQRRRPIDPRPPVDVVKQSEQRWREIQTEI